jgi:hypothetical protein
MTVLTMKESEDLLTQFISFSRSLKPWSAPTGLNFFIDYSFESSYHLFNVGDVVDVNQVAPLTLSPRKCRSARHRRKHGICTKKVNEFHLSHFAKKAALINTRREDKMSHPKDAIDSKDNQLHSSHTFPTTERSYKVNSPTKLRRSIYEARATVELIPGNNLFCDGLHNRVPFHCGAGPNVSSTRDTTTIGMMFRSVSHEHSVSCQSTAAMKVDAALTVPALLPRHNTEPMPLRRPEFRVGAAPVPEHYADISSMTSSRTMNASKQHREELWYSQGYLRGLITSAHRDGTYDIAYLPDHNRVSLLGERKDTHVRTYIPNSYPDYFTIGDRRRAGFVDKGVPQDYITTCQQHHEREEVRAYVTTQHSSTEIETTVANNTLSTANNIKYYHQMLFTDNTLARELRPWRKIPFVVGDDFEEKVDVDQILRTVFEDDLSEYSVSDSDERSTEKLSVEHTAYDTLLFDTII